MSDARTIPSFSSALVTGATGFIGGHLCERLVSCGIRTSALVRPTSSEETVAKLKRNATVISTDGSTQGLNEALTYVEPDIVFHLAAKYIAQHCPDDITTLISDNVEMTAKLCEAMTTSSCRSIVYAGTAGQHADSPSGEITSSPNTFYAASKQAADEMIDYYARKTGLNAITLKIYDSYGPYDTRRNFLSVLANAAQQGKALHASPGEQKLHIVHVDDIIEGFIHAGNLLTSGELPGRNSFSLPSPDAVTLRELSRRWMSATGIDVNIKWGAISYRPGDVINPWVGQSLPGWSPRIALEDGLRTLLP